MSKRLDPSRDSARLQELIGRLPLVLPNQLPLPTPAADVAAANRVAVDPARIGARMRSLRTARGLTGAEIANRMGIARPNYSRCERGLHEQKLFVLERFANAVGIHVCELFTVEE